MMTEEEAIDLLDNLIGAIEDNHNSDYDTAFIMAIRALKQKSPLDKIKTEIVGQKDCPYFSDYDIEIYNRGFNDAIKIIDKYAAESEK